jgi:plasmid stabilization system protein ParE
MFYLVGRSPEAAGRWLEGLRTAVDSLSQFPHRCQRASPDLTHTATSRQLLYRFGTATYRVLFAIAEVQPEQPATVRVIRVIHGSRGTDNPLDESSSVTRVLISVKV